VKKSCKGSRANSYIEAESTARTRSYKVRLEGFIVHVGDNILSKTVEEYCNGLLSREFLKT